LQLLGSDAPYSSGRGNNLTIANNLFTGIQNWFLVLSGFYNVTINHNTHFQSGNVFALTGEPSIGFVYTNNITTRSGYGYFGDNVGEGSAALAAYTPGYTFQRNLIAGASSSVYPANNFYPSSITGVLDSEYRVVNSAYKSVGTDGKDPGCDVAALNAAQSGTDTPAPDTNSNTNTNSNTHSDSNADTQPNANTYADSCTKSDAAAGQPGRSIQLFVLQRE
jgi:hypothetical protein